MANVRGDLYSKIDLDSCMSSSRSSGLDSIVPNGGYSVGTDNMTISSSFVWANSTYPSTTAVDISNDGIHLGPNADIKLGEKSLTETISKIEERLGILHPNPDLEARWEQLKSLRQQYIDLEKEILEKEKMWKILKEK